MPPQDETTLTLSTAAKWVLLDMIKSKRFTLNKNCGAVLVEIKQGIKKVHEGKFPMCKMLWNPVLQGFAIHQSK